MTKQELKDILNNEKNWELFEELASEWELEYLPNVNFGLANLENACFMLTDLTNASIEDGYIGNRKIVKIKEGK